MVVTVTIRSKGNDVQVEHDILFGTTNPRKFAHIDVIAKALPIRLLAPSQLGLDVQVDESGALPEENARLKAEAFCRVAQMPTLALDSGLFLDGLADHQQPGVHVRRVNGVTLSDEAMVDHYVQIIRDLGGRATGSWVTALAVALPDGRTNHIAVRHRTQFTADACQERTPGNPLNSLQINGRTGRYKAQEPPKEAASDQSSNSFEAQVRRLLLGTIAMLEGEER